ncbi:MAG TPA: pyrimidine dimer DNA glycosylase/endonuclease V [Candidatus Pacearchaeota archaeon]|nr:pyrimidine dimer DNA glycosylase/endonuclease V [Candidatus Pacearchaeota archaeon]
MVRINIINPKFLADQHLIAEYNETLMLLGYVKKNPELGIKNIPENYKLGPGHMLFFKNKLKYLNKRFIIIKEEMTKRGFSNNINIDLNIFNKNLINDWEATNEDKKIIKKRLIYKINLKPEYYRYYKEKKSKKFFIDMIENAE